MGMTFEINASAITDFGKALEAVPEKLTRSMAIAFKRMGKSDIDKLKAEQLSGGGGHLKVRRQGLKNAFKFWVPKNVTDLGKLSLNEFTGWKGFRIFETGGTIQPRTKRALTVLTDSARNSSGQRKWSQKQMQGMIKSGELKVIKTPKVTMIVRNVGGLTKTGKGRKNSRTDIVAFLIPQVRLRKMLDFYANFDRNAAEHDRLMGEAVQTALGNVVGDKGAK